MNYDKGFFDSPEFRELLARYEQSRRLGMSAYFGIDEFADLISYFLFIDNRDEAMQALETSKRLHPSAPENIKLEIKVLLCYGEPTQALKLFNSLKYTEDIESKTIKAEIMLALKDFKQARELAMSILQASHPEDDCVYDALEVLLDCGFALDALAICEKALKAAPGRSNLLEVKGECLIELQRINEAVEIYNRLLDTSPYSTFYWEQLGHIYYMVKRFGKALECFEFELTINEEIEYAAMMQAYCYYHLRNYEKAKEIFITFANKYEKSVIPFFYIGLINHHQGKTAEAIAAFAVCISRAKEGTIEMMLSRINRAMLLNSIGNEERADEGMSMALLMHPDNMKQLVLTGKHLYELRDKENLTFDDMNTLESKEWNTEDTLYKLGAHLVKHNHLAMAKRVFKYCRDISYDPSDIDAHIAYILWNSDRREEAATAIENALEGRSCVLFDLFGLPYSANMDTASFIEAAQKKGEANGNAQ